MVAHRPEGRVLALREALSRQHVTLLSDGADGCHLTRPPLSAPARACGINHCSPNSGFAVRLGPVEMLSGEVSPLEMPQSARLLFPASAPSSPSPAFPASRVPDGPVVQGLESARRSPYPWGNRRERDSSWLEPWAGVLSQVRAGRRALGWGLRGDPGLTAAPGACPARTCLLRRENVTRPGISIDACAPVSQVGEQPLPPPGWGAPGPRPQSGRLDPRSWGCPL